MRGTVVVPLYSDMNNKSMDWPLIMVVMKTEICTVTTSAVGLAPLSLQQMQQGKGIFLVMFDICDPPQEFDAKGESTRTTRLACRRSRICAY